MGAGPGHLGVGRVQVSQGVARFFRERGGRGELRALREAASGLPPEEADPVLDDAEYGAKRLSLE